jgi:hypothetical protein
MVEFLYGVAVGLVPVAFLCFHVSRLHRQLAYWLSTISLMLKKNSTEGVEHVADQRRIEAIGKGWWKS